jgi:hypothetical protein
LASLKRTSSEEVKISYEEWLKRKREQSEKERELQRNLEKIEQMALKNATVSPEEKTKAYKEYFYFFFFAI